MKFAPRHVHFVGIGGAGMSGIAEVLATQGTRVTGSDAVASPVLEQLRARGIEVHVGHAAEHVGQAQAVVVSSAVREDNPEVQAARARRIPVIPRALMLAELMRMRRGIAVAGTHGKTTTTSLIASVLGEGGLDPTFVIGGRLLAAGTNARLGSGEWLVAEADESDASFLHLTPTLAVITNIDRDHMDTYEQSLARLDRAFIDFAHRLPFYGALYACADDPGVARILPAVSRPIVTYGTSATADVRAVGIQSEGARMRFTALRSGSAPLAVELRLTGLHNVVNALAAIAIGQDLGVADRAIQRALAQFAGVGRRLQSYGERLLGARRFHLIDDYGHHPREIEATLSAVRGAFPGRPILLAFQPHRYTRTRDLFDDFVAVLERADKLVLTEVYPAGEAPLPAADGRSLARAVRVRGRREPLFAEDLAALEALVLDSLADGDVVLLMGAGSIASLAPRLAEQSATEGNA
ncbi:MAG: UDP-N-acetylmuramate--L-alanine ligase [Casimicrobiaceae bacterium]|nr:UDP-N-acetylmuramate--L-alanine ligase [Casimicrobiaceae bacterium]MCX8098814.1 UDP-N-acetylmuramate--L-alanine ligase [Casimicrobiaceae bacterium]MDW8311533.1 UDP-N-acetylmuramate--L-alanine ligase [Burkholderiales bacterium]